TKFYTLSLHDALPISMMIDKMLVVNTPFFSINCFVSIVLWVDKFDSNFIFDHFVISLDSYIKSFWCYTMTLIFRCGSPVVIMGRSEEHTSELQSRENL